MLAKSFRSRENYMERFVDGYYAYCAKHKAEDAVFVDWKPDSERFDRILPE